MAVVGRDVDRRRFGPRAPSLVQTVPGLICGRDCKQLLEVLGDWLEREDLAAVAGRSQGAAVLALMGADVDHQVDLSAPQHRFASSCQRVPASANVQSQTMEERLEPVGYGVLRHLQIRFKIRLTACIPRGSSRVSQKEIRCRSSTEGMNLRPAAAAAEASP